MRLLETSTQSQELLTGLLYINEKNQSLGDKLNITETPIRKLDLASIKPSNEKLKNLMKDFS